MSFVPVLHDVKLDVCLFRGLSSVPVPTLDFDISYSSAILFDDVLI